MVCDTALLLNQAIATARPSCSRARRAPCSISTTAPIRSSLRRARSAGGACTGTGVAPTRITRRDRRFQGLHHAGGRRTVSHRGAGRRTARPIRQRGNEFGAVTGRPRRCGWFDAPLLRYTAAINGFDSIVVTKLDVLDEFETIPVCVGYQH